MVRRSANFGRIVHGIAMLMVGGWVSMTAASPGFADAKDSKAAKVSKKKSVAELIELLDHKSYAIRTASSRALSEYGRKAIAPLSEVARTGSLEASARAIAILERIYTDLDGDDATVEQVESTLERLRESKRATVSGRAAQVLSRNSDLREKRALAAIKRLGGIVRYYDSQVLLGGPPQGLPAVEGRTISYILLGDLWKGGDEGVKYLKRIPGLRNLYVAQNKKFQPISAKAREDLEKSIPNLSIQLRGLACLGVRGNVTNVNGNGCTVSSVDKGSAADLGKVKAYDQIAKFDGKPVDNFESLVKLIADHSPGEKVELEVIRPDRAGPRRLKLQVAVPADHVNGVFNVDAGKYLMIGIGGESVDQILIISPDNVQYLTGFRPHRLMSAAVALHEDGKVVLAAPNQQPENVAADEIVTFEAQWHATLRQEQPQAAASVLADAVRETGSVRTLAFEASICGPRWLSELGVADVSTMVDIDPYLRNLRRCKDPDELAMIRRAIACTDAMYQMAREIIRPGITELEVFNRLHAAAVEVAGEPLTALGNDYQCNSPGGPPRSRAAQAGELFILDLGPAYRGYYADNCRTFAVDGKPTDAQQSAWSAIVAVLQMVEETVKPGVSCRELFERAQTMLDEYRPGAFSHHLGHGFGLFPHEAPHLNPNWDDEFEFGDCFTAEPGLYGDELKAGIRLEQNYRVTDNGVERLTSFPLEL
eukprot:g12514.t1